MKAVNKEQLQLYWDLGKMIVEKQKQTQWGKSVVEKIAKDLQAEFVGERGFSARNMWRMKQFYELYSESVILPPLVAEIGWSHNAKMIFDKEKRCRYLALFVLPAHAVGDFFYKLLICNVLKTLHGKFGGTKNSP